MAAARTRPGRRAGRRVPVVILRAVPVEHDDQQQGPDPGGTE
ncbi:hypothetical protein [Arthrobacter sp. RIT-PI-e]|nr:hypothetical protein [Arthrobacter sp. RIT-PI-e]